MPTGILEYYGHSSRRYCDIFHQKIVGDKHWKKLLRKLLVVK